LHGEYEDATELSRRAADVTFRTWRGLIEWLDEEAARQGRSRAKLINWLLEQRRREEQRPAQPESARAA